MAALSEASQTSEVSSTQKRVKPRRFSFYFNWLLKVTYICIDHNEDVKRFDNDLLHDYYSNGLTPYEAFKQLLSELPKLKVRGEK